MRGTREWEPETWNRHLETKPSESRYKKKKEFCRTSSHRDARSSNNVDKNRTLRHRRQRRHCDSQRKDVSHHKAFKIVTYTTPLMQDAQRYRESNKILRQRQRRCVRHADVTVTAAVIKVTQRRRRPSPQSLHDHGAGALYCFSLASSASLHFRFGRRYTAGTRTPPGGTGFHGFQVFACRWSLCSTIFAKF